MTDLELLKEYGQTRSEAAFGELVRRHLDWVYSAAARQVRDRELAEDVAQGVFVALARQAKSLGRDQSLSPWLLRVTRCAAISALRAVTRRERHEQKAAAMRPESTEAVTEWEELAPMLDEGVLRLGKKDREAVLLRFYERKSFADVGQVMGVSEKAAAKRVERAVEKLRGALAKKGVMAGAGALGLVMAERVTEAAPAGLVKAAMAAVGAGESGSAGVIAKGAIKMMAWAKVKVAAVAVLTIGMASGVGVVASQGVGKTSPPETAQATPAAQPVPAKESAGELALARWGALISESVARDISKKIGGNAGSAPADEVRAIVQGGIDSGQRVYWLFWLPTAQLDWALQFPSGVMLPDNTRLDLKTPVTKYQREADSFRVIPGARKWTLSVTPADGKATLASPSVPERLDLGRAYVELVAMPGSFDRILLVHEPWLYQLVSNAGQAAATFPSPAIWVKHGPAMAGRLFKEALDAAGKLDHERLIADGSMVQRIDDKAEIRLRYLCDLERNPLLDFSPKAGRPVKWSFYQRSGNCAPAQPAELEVYLRLTDPRVVYGYTEDGEAVVLDEDVDSVMIAYVSRQEKEFSRWFGTGEYERLGRCEAKERQAIALGDGATSRVKVIGGKAQRSGVMKSGLQGSWSVTMDGAPKGEGEYVVIGMDEQDRPHFPIYYAPKQVSADDKRLPGPRLEDGIYAIRGELKSLEIWHRPWKKVTFGGYARELRTEGK